MTVSLVGSAQKRRAVEEITPAAQASTNATAVVTGSGLDAGPYDLISYTIVIATEDVDWSVFGANSSDYSDEVAVVSATTVGAGTASSYTADAGYRYYRVKIIDTVGDTHGTATVRGLAK